MNVEDEEEDDEEEEEEGWENREDEGKEDDGMEDEGMGDEAMENEGIEDEGIEDEGMEDEEIEDEGMEDEGREDNLREERKRKEITEDWLGDFYYEYWSASDNGGDNDDKDEDYVPDKRKMTNMVTRKDLKHSVRERKRRITRPPRLRIFGKMQFFYL